MNTEKFKNALYQPLSREEVIAHIEGRGTTRPPFAATCVFYKPEGLNKEEQKRAWELLEKYPDDIQCFSYVRPKNFGNPGEYCWCDVPGADPSIGRVGDVGIDEQTAIDWDVIEQISENVPDPYMPEEMIVNPEEPDGRYRGVFWTRLCFERLWHFRGMENALCDFYLYPEQVHKLLRKLLNIYKRAIDRAKDEYQADAWMMTDDIGMQNGPFFSEEIFVEFLKPIYKELIEYLHSKGMHMWLHTCGNVEPFIPHLIEIGLDVLHPIQKHTMDEEKIMEQYGDKICIWAGMDVQRTLPFGTEEEVRQETRYMIENYYLPGKGRLILAPGNNMTVEDIPLSNIEAFMDEGRKYGMQVWKEGKTGNLYSPYKNKER